MIKENDWIEIAPIGHHISRYAKVFGILDESVQVIYLDGSQPVKDRMVLDDGQWVWERSDPSGVKIFDRVKILREEIQNGPPQNSPAQRYSDSERPTDPVVWLQSHLWNQ